MENGVISAITALPFSRCQTVEWGSIESDELLVCLLRNAMPGGRRIILRLCLEGFEAEVFFPKGVEYVYVGERPKLKSCFRDKQRKEIYRFEFQTPSLVVPAKGSPDSGNRLYLPNVLVCVTDEQIRQAEKSVSKEWRKRTGEADPDVLFEYVSKLRESTFVEHQITLQKIRSLLELGLITVSTPLDLSGDYTFLCSLPREKGSALWQILTSEDSEIRRKLLRELPGPKSLADWAKFQTSRS